MAVTAWGVGVAVGVAVWVVVEEAVKVEDGVKVPEGVAVGVEVAVFVAVTVGVKVMVRVAVKVAVEVTVPVAVRVMVTVRVGVGLKNGPIGTANCRSHPTIKATGSNVITIKLPMIFFTLTSPGKFCISKQLMKLRRGVRARNVPYKNSLTRNPRKPSLIRGNTPTDQLKLFRPTPESQPSLSK
jgi:hypothetical protein